MAKLNHNLFQWIILLVLFYSLQLFNEISTQSINKDAYTCPYLWMHWKQRRTFGWICGSVPYLQTKVPGVKFENDCCPGYEKTELLDNKCAFIDRSWQTIIDQLRDQKSLQIAQTLTNGNNLQDLSSNSTKNTLAPLGADPVVYDTDAVGAMVSPGRWYSKEFHNGQKIPTTKEVNKRVKRSIRVGKRKYVEDLASTAEKAARDGNMKQLYNTTKNFDENYCRPERPVKSKEGKLTFLDCKALLSPDHEASNGLIHRIDGSSCDYKLKFTDGLITNRSLVNEIDLLDTGTNCELSEER
ncbi:unnamed protein product [Schistosoma margrebowiei]|uniref:Uncharacterized protein n=1 Tax=Schistosoma margrebowiei TaxID=48269 RepID=A0A183MMP9_9TREM|nr:unnamed protein product [Schistosoma margrebowiei]